MVEPRCDTGTMNAHLSETSAMVAPGAQAVVILDKAGWHLSGSLHIPTNVTLMPQPSRAPELNSVENIGQYLRNNRLSDHVFEDYEAILKHCCNAWNMLIARPWKIMTTGLREWAREF